MHEGRYVYSYRSYFLSTSVITHYDYHLEFHDKKLIIFNYKRHDGRAIKIINSTGFNINNKITFSSKPTIFCEHYGILYLFFEIQRKDASLLIC